MGAADVVVDDTVPDAKLPANMTNNPTMRRASNQSTSSTAAMTDAASASAITNSPSSARADADAERAIPTFAYGSSLPTKLPSPWNIRESSMDVARSAPSSSSMLLARKAKSMPKSKTLSETEGDSLDTVSNPPMSATASAMAASESRRGGRKWSRSAVTSHLARRHRSNDRSTDGRDEPVVSTGSAVDRRLLEKYERVNSEIERVIRSTNADMMNSENCELLNKVRSELRKTKRNSSQIIQSQKELLEKMERQERGGLRRLFSLNREHKMEKLRHKLCEKLDQSVAVEEQLDRLERQSVSLTRMSFGSMYSPGVGLEIDELTELERERDDILNNLLSSARLTDAQELHSRLALFTSEKRACECSLKQVEQCETLYRKALHLLRIALSTILSSTYTGGLKEFVLGPYPLAVEASQLIEQSCRAIQPESRRRYKSYTPELSNVRPPKFPQPMTDFAKRGTRANFDPSSSAAIEAMRKLRISENVVILLQRIVIAKLELIEKWRRDVERDFANAEEGYWKVDARLQEQMVKLARTVTAA